MAQIVEPKKIEVVDTEFELGPHDVAVKVAACGICSWESGFYTGDRATPLPRPIGHEPSGVVVSVGAEVTDWKPGDRVAGLFGPAFATYAKARIRCSSACLTTWRSSTRSSNRRSASSPASGPRDPSSAITRSSSAAASWASCCSPGSPITPLASLIAVDMLDERLELARGSSARRHCLNPRRDDVLARVAEITGGHGIDVAMEASTVPAG